MGSGGNLAVFVVEDNPTARLCIKQLIDQSTFCHVVGEASDGKAAVDEVVRLKPDVVIMDIELPCLDGIDATIAIKEREPGTKVILVTHYDDDERVCRAIAAGVDGYCLKSERDDLLLQAIRTVAFGGAWLTTAIAERIVAKYAPVSGESDEAGVPDNVGAILTPGEHEIVDLVVAGRTSAEIAEQLGLPLEEVKDRMNALLQKLTASDQIQQAVRAVLNNLT